MKNIVTIFIIMCSIYAYGQTSIEHIENGILKHNEQDYQGAIEDYTKAIKVDNKNKDAYFNRGTCHLAIKDFKSAKTDFEKLIQLDDSNAKAYYSRASVYVSQEKYLESLPDLDKTIELDPTTPNALTLRGQIRAQTGDKKGACKDFEDAMNIGDSAAAGYLEQFCGNEQRQGESLMLHWPEEENWKIGNSQENKEMDLLELIHADETLENWTEIGSMMSFKGATNIPMDVAMNMMFDGAKKTGPKSKLTFIEKNETEEFPWILFMIESPSFTNDKTPESQLWYIVQGKTSLYANFRAIKESAIPSETRDKWVAFFKTGKVVYK